ncbi:MAG: hypothetical protein AAF942_01025 [Pseudomonadota bacterium]
MTHLKSGSRIVPTAFTLSLLLVNAPAFAHHEHATVFAPVADHVHATDVLGPGLAVLVVGLLGAVFALRLRRSSASRRTAS